jgi:hypothetical protein
MIAALIIIPISSGKQKSHIMPILLFKNLHFLNETYKTSLLITVVYGFQHIAMCWTRCTLLCIKAAFVSVHPHNRSSPSPHFRRNVANLRTIIVIADIDQGLHRPAGAHSERDHSRAQNVL